MSMIEHSPRRFISASEAVVRQPETVPERVNVLGVGVSAINMEMLLEAQDAGTYTPPFRPLTAKEDAELIRTINRADPDIVWVGLSTPKQERWMAEHAGRLNAAALIGVGAAFDFHAGLKRQAPRWVQHNG